MLGALLINILGCGSGLMLGASTILVRDVVANVQRKFSKLQMGMSQLLQTRLAIVVLLAIAVAVANTFEGSFINDLGFLSLGLRAVAIIFPLSFALWLPGRFSPRGVMLAMVAGTAAMLLAGWANLPGDAVYYGLATSLVIILLSKKK